MNNIFVSSGVISVQMEILKCWLLNLYFFVFYIDSVVNIKSARKYVIIMICLLFAAA